VRQSSARNRLFRAIYSDLTFHLGFALGALLAASPAKKWIHRRASGHDRVGAFRPWVSLLASTWAYAVAGWGGLLGWDPVRERVPSLPWADGRVSTLR